MGPDRIKRLQFAGAARSRPSGACSSGRHHTRRHAVGYVFRSGVEPCRSPALGSTVEELFDVKEIGQRGRSLFQLGRINDHLRIDSAAHPAWNDCAGIGSTRRGHATGPRRQAGTADPFQKSLVAGLDRLGQSRNGSHRPCIGACPPSPAGRPGHHSRGGGAHNYIPVKLHRSAFARCFQSAAGVSRRPGHGQNGRMTGEEETGRHRRDSSRKVRAKRTRRRRFMGRDQRTGASVGGAVPAAGLFRGRLSGYLACLWRLLFTAWPAHRTPVPVLG